MLHNLELTSYQRNRLVAAEAPPVVSRAVAIALLLMLICGQVLWAVKRYAPAAAAAEVPLSMATVSRAAVGATASEGALSEAAPQPARRKNSRAPQATAVATKTDAVAVSAPRPAPVRRSLRASDVCLALSGALPEVALSLEGDRRTEVLDTLTQLQKAEEQGRQAILQARAAFSEDQLKEMLPLIGTEPYASMQGLELEEKAHEVMTKVADGAEAPAAEATGVPLADATRLTRDEILRGALALENTSVMLSRSQAAQIDTAVADLANAQKRQQLWRKQLLGQLTADERASLTAHLSAVNPALEASPRLVRDAIASLEAAEQP